MQKIELEDLKNAFNATYSIYNSNLYDGYDYFKEALGIEDVSEEYYYHLYALLNRLYNGLVMIRENQANENAADVKENLDKLNLLMKYENQEISSNNSSFVEMIEEINNASEADKYI